MLFSHPQNAKLLRGWWVTVRGSEKEDEEKEKDAQKTTANDFNLLPSSSDIILLLCYDDASREVHRGPSRSSEN